MTADKQTAVYVYVYLLTIAGNRRGVGDHIQGRLIMKGVIWANKIITRRGAFDHASHAPQLRSCNYYVLAPGICSVDNY